VLLAVPNGREIVLTYDLGTAIDGAVDVDVDVVTTGYYLSPT
jgi:hypothetical protein